jgi:F-type H+-transporting ATPase subunit c
VLFRSKAVEAVGRNPGAATEILVQSIIGMALVEGLGVLALFLATK